MPEQLRSVAITVEIETSKETLRGTFHAVDDLVEWWNRHAPDLNLAEYTLSDRDEPNDKDRD